MYRHMSHGRGIRDPIAGVFTQHPSLWFVFLLTLFVMQRDNVSAGNGWRVMPIRSQQEFTAGKVGGEGEQHPHSIARCLHHPEIIYLSHDVGQVWKSNDGGETWKKPLGIGLYQIFGQSIEVDPHNPDVVLLTVATNWNWLAPNFEGLYRSTDGGNTWDFVLPTATNFNSGLHRIYRHNIAYAPDSSDEEQALRWYAGFPDNGLFQSNDGGKTWQPRAALPGHNPLYAVVVNPEDGDMVYVGSNNGLFRSIDQGQHFPAWGNLPNGGVSSIAINPDNPSEIFATVIYKGLYRSDNGGQTFQLIRTSDAVRVFMNPGHPETLYLVGESSNAVISHDGGKTWITDMTTQPAPGLGRTGSDWKSKIAGQLTGIVPDPSNAQEAVAFSRATLWKTTDGGQHFVDSSTGFTGFAWGWWNDGAAFDAADPNRIAFFNFDIGPTVTDNGGDWFELRNNGIRSWFDQGLISWTGAYAGDFDPTPNSQLLIASVGGQWANRLVRSTDEGRTWQLVSEADVNYFFIAFHPGDPNVVYAGNKISHNKGQSFEPLDFGSFGSSDPTVAGFCRANPDVVYAMSSDRREIFRSNNRGSSWVSYTRPGWKFSRLDAMPTFAADPADPDVIYTLNGSYDLAVFDGSNWRSTGVLALAGGTAQGNFVRSVAVDPRHPEVVYAGMYAAGIECIWRSTDKGRTWKNITYNLGRIGITGLTVSPHTGEVFRGSATGTWILPPPYESPTVIYDKLASAPPDWRFALPDFARFAGIWLASQCGTCDFFDFNYDANVELVDFLAFVSNWLS